MKSIALLFAVMLSGCMDRQPEMTNDQIIAEVKKCKDAGMDWEPLVYQSGIEIMKGQVSGTIKVQCTGKLAKDQP